MNSIRKETFIEAMDVKITYTVVFEVLADGSTFDPSWEGETILVKFPGGINEYSNTGISRVV